jgi:AcrR family transcriptional regulator
MKTPSSKKNGTPGDEARPSKGEASRATILLTAAKLATARGLDGLSIGDLAAEVGMSKSGLYAHFKSKEELELATIETASAIFDREVLQPAAPAPAGTGRLRALVDAFLLHLERRVFPGGCFFASVASELDTRPGPARDRVVQMLDKWHSLFRQCILDAQARHDQRPDAADPSAQGSGARVNAADGQGGAEEETIRSAIAVTFRYGGVPSFVAGPASVPSARSVGATSPA